MLTLRPAPSLKLLFLLASGAFLGCAGTADRLIDRAGQAGEREAAERVDRGASGAADAAEEAILSGGQAEAEDERASTGGGAATDAADPAAAAPTVTSTTVDDDFQRGERPIGQWDFSSDVMGDFPRRLELGQGSWDVVEVGGRRMLRGTGGRFSDFTVPLPETLPERFTLEFDVMFSTPNQQIVVATSPIEGRSVQRYPASLLRIRKNGTGLSIPSQDRLFTAPVEGENNRVLDQPTTIRMMADGNHVKVYAGDKRLANIPNAPLDRTDRLHFMDVYASSPRNPIYIGSIRVDAGGRDLYAALERDGRVTLRDILFDTDSDRIRPESQVALEEIGAMLREHTDLRLAIEGHTDNEGADDYNLDLSTRRAEAVRRWLIDKYGIEGVRLVAEGLGETRPVAPNDTEEGRRQNRRVELVRIG